MLRPPRAQLPGAQPQLGRHLRQALAVLKQPLDRLRLELGREPPPGSLLRHVALLGCWGSLANPPLPRGRSNRLNGSIGNVAATEPSASKDRSISGPSAVAWPPSTTERRHGSSGSSTTSPRAGRLHPTPIACSAD